MALLDGVGKGVGGEDTGNSFSHYQQNNVLPLYITCMLSSQLSLPSNSSLMSFSSLLLPFIPLSPSFPLIRPYAISPLPPFPRVPPLFRLNTPRFSTPPWSRRANNPDEYWATRSSLRSHRSLIRLLRPARFACAFCCAHSFAHSLIATELVGKSMINAAKSGRFGPQCLKLRPLTNPPLLRTPAWQSALSRS